MKKIKYTYIVDITSCNTDIDVIMQFVDAKINAGVVITPMEYKTLITYTTDCAIDFSKELDNAVNAAGKFANDIANAITDKVIAYNESNKKKPNLLKRFWNWLTRKK